MLVKLTKGANSLWKLLWSKVLNLVAQGNIIKGVWCHHGPLLFVCTQEIRAASLVMGVCELDDEAKANVLRQVEFYFSDSNLPGDKFLLKTIEENEDGLISLALVCSFTRMRGHLGLKEHGPEKVPPEITKAVADVLRGSTSLRVSEDGSKVGRMAELKSPEAARAEVDSRSIAANPFPFNVTLDEVEAFFKQHSTVKSVRLPRIPGVNAFAGYATVELDSVEEAERILTLKLVLHGATLELETKKAFDDRQAISVQSGQRNGHTRRSNLTGRSGEDQDDFPKNRVISFTLRKLSTAGSVAQEAQQAAEENEKKDAQPMETSEEGSDKEKTRKEDDTVLTEQAVEAIDAKQAGETINKGREVSIEGQVAREDIKGALEKYGTINFIDYSRGEESGYVRFEEDEAARQARAGAILASDGGLLVKGHILSLEPVEGEAEREYWRKVREGQGKRRDGGGRGGYNDRGRGRGGRFGRGRGGRGRGRSGDGTDEAGNNGVAKGKHMHFDDDEGSQVKKVARIE